MASRTIFDPSTLLRMSPLLAATCTLWANIDHALFLDFAPTPKSSSRPTSPLAALFSLYEANTTGLAAVVGAALNLVHASPPPTTPNPAALGGASAAASAASVLASWRAGDWTVDWRAPPTLYLAGLALTAAHLAVQPYLQRVVRDLASARNDFERRRAGWRWRRAVFARALLLDLPAWGCFLGAAMGSLRPVSV